MLPRLLTGSIRHIRVVWGDSDSLYHLLVLCTSVPEAVVFHDYFHGKPLSALVCTCAEVLSASWANFFAQLDQRKVENKPRVMAFSFKKIRNANCM